MIASKGSAELNDCTAPSKRFISGQGLAAKLSLASLQAPVSISMALTLASDTLCFAISASNPVPVPISKMRLALFISAHAPNKIPSVDTFIAVRVCVTVNCLNTKPDIFSPFHSPQPR